MESRLLAAAAQASRLVPLVGSRPLSMPASAGTVTLERRPAGLAALWHGDPPDPGQHWQPDSLPVSHHGSPRKQFLIWP